MKRIVLQMTAVVLLLTLLLSATACSTSFQSPEEYQDLPERYQAGTDFPMNLASSTLGNIASTGKGYFFFQNSFLKYFDKESLEIMPVCNRPECPHNSTACSAFFSASNSTFLQIYEGKLYLEAVGNDKNGVWLYEVNTDDCTRKMICQLPYDNDSVHHYMMHRGYLYMTSYKAVAKTVSLERVALNELTEKSLTPELLFEHDSLSYSLSYVFGNHFFVLYQQKGAIGMDNVWIDVDLRTLEQKEVEFPDIPEGAYITLNRDWEDKLIATYVDLNAYLQGDRTMVLYSYDPVTGVFEPFVTLPDRGEGIYDYYAWDGKNHLAFYMDLSSGTQDYLSTQEFRVLDENFETVKRISTDYFCRTFIVGDEDFTFFVALDGDVFSLFAIDKRGEEMQVIKVFE